MQTRFWARSLALLGFSTACALAADRPSLKLPSGQVLACSPGPKTTFCSVSSPSGPRGRVVLARDATVRTHPTVSLKLVGAAGSAVILVDSYPSKPEGLSMCQAGTESFLRVLDLGPGAPKETLHTKLESCQNSVELALDGLNWDSATGTLHIHWLTSPDGGHESEKTVRLDTAGHILP